MNDFSLSWKCLYAQLLVMIVIDGQVRRDSREGKHMNLWFRCCSSGAVLRDLLPVKENKSNPLSYKLFPSSNLATAAPAPGCLA